MIPKPSTQRNIFNWFNLFKVLSLAFLALSSPASAAATRREMSEQDALHLLQNEGAMGLCHDYAIKGVASCMMLNQLRSLGISPNDVHPRISENACSDRNRLFQRMTPAQQEACSVLEHSNGGPRFTNS
ncbi:MAG: hypothetical protein ABI597_10875 [Gammaproteobacteria bacterium]